MFHARPMRAALICGLVALSASPVVAHAQFGGLVNRAKQAVRPDKSESHGTRNNVVAITSENLAAYIRGNSAQRAEVKRLDSVRTLADNTPEGARQVALLQCRSKAMSGIGGTPEQRRADSARLVKSIASLDTVKMKKLAKAAQAGDAAAMAELQQMSMQYAHSQATDPEAIAARERTQKQMEASIRQSTACDNSVPPASSFAGPIANAKAEMAKYGSQSSPAYAAHLSSVKLKAADGMNASEYAVLEERILAYASSSPELTQGFTAAELSVLRAHRSELDALRR